MNIFFCHPFYSSASFPYLLSTIPWNLNLIFFVQAFFEDLSPFGDQSDKEINDYLFHGSLAIEPRGVKQPAKAVRFTQIFIISIFLDNLILLEEGDRGNSCCWPNTHLPNRVVSCGSRLILDIKFIGVVVYETFFALVNSI